MGRHRKEKSNIRLSTLNVGIDVLDSINELKRQGETQDQCMRRILYQYNDIKEITDNYVFLQQEYNDQCARTAKYVQENEQLKSRLKELGHQIIY